MSTSVRVETVLRVIAETAAQRLPLAAALRREAGALGGEIADGLDRGLDLPAALAAHLSEPIRILLAGPFPPLAEAALLAAEQLQQVRTERAERLDSILHPLLNLALIPIFMRCIQVEGRMGVTPWFLLPGLAVALLAGAMLWAACRPAEVPSWGLIARMHYHQRMGWRYGRAALVARWRLPDAQLAQLLGHDLEAIIPLLATPQAEEEIRSLARSHREDAARCRRRLHWIIAALLFISCGLLLLSAAVGPVRGILEDLRFLGSSE